MATLGLSTVLMLAVVTAYADGVQPWIARGLRALGRRLEGRKPPVAPAA